MRPSNACPQQFQGEHMGTANAYKPMILEMGLDWKPISLNAQDTQFIESRKMTEAQLCGSVPRPASPGGEPRQDDRGTISSTWARAREPRLCRSSRASRPASESGC